MDITAFKPKPALCPTASSNSRSVFYYIFMLPTKQKIEILKYVRYLRHLFPKKKSDENQIYTHCLEAILM